MKPIMRTTVILDEELRKKLKTLSLQKDISMKEIITQALEEKIQRELDGTDIHDEFSDNLLVAGLIEMLEPVIGPAATRVLIVQTCKKFKTTPRKLSKGDITREFTDLICKKVADISSGDEVVQLRKSLQTMVKKR